MPSKHDRSLFNPLVPQRTWTELFFAAHAPADDKVKTAPALNRVVVTPTDPLPVGKDWTLVAAAGLPGTDAGLKTPARTDVSRRDRATI